MAKTIQESEITKMMEKLELTREEAVELIQFDQEEIECQEEIELTKKAKPIAKEMTQVSRKPMEEKPKMAGVTTQTRARKEDKTKQLIIETIHASLLKLENVEKLEITNKEKTIILTIGEDDFEIDLKKKRKKK